ncbi:Ras-associated and pleckstrin homology domains-containing protein 1 [Schistosoma japonicum]|nr:Ras-associated and pleckstrin homology domains-containing protein 1 [Schistosoma japonicum]
MSLEATAEHDLSSLLRELEVVEEKMKELEQENNQFTRRYSLASSSNGKRSIHPGSEKSTVETTNSATKVVEQPVLSLSVPDRNENLNKSNGFICAEWVAKINHDEYDNPTINANNKFVKKDTSPSPPPPPPAFLGAGDACASPTNSPPSSSYSPHSQLLVQQSHMHSLQIQQSPQQNQLRNDGSWSVIHANNPMNGIKSNQLTSYDGGLDDKNREVAQAYKTSQNPVYNSHSYQNFNTQKQLVDELRGLYRNSSIKTQPKYSAQPNNGRQIHYSNTSSSSSPPPNFLSDMNSYVPTPISNLNEINKTSNSDINNSYVCSKRSDVYRSYGSLATNQGTNNSDPGIVKDEDCEDNITVNDTGCWTPDQMFARRDCHIANSLAARGGSDGLSNSMSPESSLSDKSGSEANELNRIQMPDGPENNHANKLVVRVFRPDRTTKAVLIEHQMTAGEVATMMIEKNFLQPSVHLVLVEKVPALKIERVFEEHDIVSDCILAWPTKSQNMIFFEERLDHFGPIESPDYWVGEDTSTKQAFRSAEAIQTMLNNIDTNGFPEWRDYLFIRKPGDKSWSRRLCVLRSSGLYTSNKNKKSFSSTDLIRILVLDGPLKLYTTTGGWSRMRAPTPHGFAFKPYSAQDPSSTHVFCFCATDEKALRHWISRLRIAKYGRQLLTDYHMALSRVHQLISLRNQLSNNSNRPNTNMLNLNLHPKSSFDYLSQSSSSIHAPIGNSQRSLLNASSSPSVFPRCAGDSRYSENHHHQQQQYSCSRQSLHPNIHPSYSARPVSPLSMRARMIANSDHPCNNLNHSSGLHKNPDKYTPIIHNPLDRYK